MGLCVRCTGLLDIEELPGQVTERFSTKNQSRHHSATRADIAQGFRL